jgi:hypothetical protein
MFIPQGFFIERIEIKKEFIAINISTGLITITNYLYMKKIREK